MIEQKAIFESAQTAFEAHHPKFPWPKKHSLEDQTDDFKKAFLVFSTDINAMADRDIKILVDEVNAIRSRMVEEMNEASSARDKARIARNRADDAQELMTSFKNQSHIAWCTVAVLGFILVLTFLN